MNINNVLNRNSGVDRADNKSPFFMNRKESNSESNSTGATWNPLKTIGGERNRIIFQDEPAQNSNLSKDISKDKE